MRGQQYGRAARLALFYALCATAWIIGSSWVTRHVSDAAGFELIKGLGFVAATSCLLFLVLLTHDRKARQAADRTRRLIESSGDVAFLYRAKPHPHIEYASDIVLTWLGLDPADLRERANALAWLVHPADRHLLPELLTLQTRHGVAVRWVTADGRVVHTILDVLSVTDRRGRAVALEGRLRNVTDERRDKVESALAEAILEDVPERLDATQLAQRTCERLVAMAEAEMAWFGVPLDDGTVQIVASEGDSEYLENLQVRWDDGPLSLGPAGIAIRERRPIAMTPDQPGYEAWRARAFNARLTASLAIPLTHEQAVVGVLVVSSRFGNPFDDAHIARFTRTADRLAIVLAATGQELDASTTRRTRLAPEHTWFDLPAALDAGRIEVWWQPQVASADGRIVAVEALVRGRTEAGEVVLPSVILPEAERAGLMVRLGRQLRRLAVEQAPQWLALGVERVALNASISELHEPGFALELAELVDRHSLDRDCIEVELVESAPLDMRAARAVAELSISGFRIAVDDYGSGWASLGHLAQLPATTLKIDRVFVRDLGTSNRADQLVRSTFELARTLGLTAVAEGVETVAQAHALASMGCELHQGFLFARPMPTIEFDRLLRHHREHRPASWAGPLLPDA